MSKKKDEIGAAELFGMCAIGMFFGFILGFLIFYNDSQVSKETLHDVCFNFTKIADVQGSVNTAGKIICTLPSAPASGIIIKTNSEEENLDG